MWITSLTWNNMDTLITIQLTDFEAKAFAQFQKHRELIGVLESVDAFNIKGGSITIHFDALGRIGAVDKWQKFALTRG